MVSKPPTKKQLHYDGFWKTAKSHRSLHNAWVPAEEWIRLFRKTGFESYKVRFLNEVMKSKCIGNMCQEQELGLLVLYNSKSVWVQHESGSKKYIRYFYYVTKYSDIDSLPKIPKDTSPYQEAWNLYETTVAAKENRPPTPKKRGCSSAQKSDLNSRQTTNATIATNNNGNHLMPNPCTPSPPRAKRLKLAESPTSPPTFTMPPTPPQTNQAVCKELKQMYYERYRCTLPPNIGKTMLENEVSCCVMTCSTTLLIFNISHVNTAIVIVHTHRKECAYQTFEGKDIS